MFDNLKYRAWGVDNKTVFGGRIMSLPSGNTVLLTLVSAKRDRWFANHVQFSTIREFVGYTEQGEALYAGDVYFAD